MPTPNSARNVSLDSIEAPPGQRERLPHPVLEYSAQGPARDSVWLEYLRAIRGRSVSQLVAINAERIWRHLRPLASRIAIPDAAVTESGSLFMSWDRGIHHLEIELLSNGRYEWFYRNRNTDIFGGDYDYPATVLAPELLAQFRLVAENA